MQRATRILPDFCSIQDAIDKGPGVVYIPEGEHVIDTPLVLPRTDLVGEGGVSLKGAGMQRTIIRASEKFIGNCLITWQPATAIHRRAWFQSIEGLTLELPEGDGYGILYKRTPLAIGNNDPLFQKMTINIRDLRIKSFMNWRQVGIKLEGNIHDSIIEKILLDIGGKFGSALPEAEKILFDSTLIEVDVSPAGDDGNDNFGLFSSAIRNISTGQVYGGQGGVFRGRAMLTSFDDIMIGNGCLRRPAIELIGSSGVSISNYVNEGRGGNPQIRLLDCRGVVLDNIVCGTPDERTLDAGGINPDVVIPAGEGIHMQACTYCEVKNWFTHPDKALWDIDRSRRRIWIDRDSNNCTVDVMIGGSSFDTNRQEDPIAVIHDESKNSWIKTLNAATLATVVRYNGQVLVWP